MAIKPLAIAGVFVIEYVGCVARNRSMLRTILTLFAAMATGAACAETYTQFSYVRPWTVVKRESGACSAIAQGPSQGDTFVLSDGQSGVILSMGNPKFQIPPVNIPLNFH